MGRLLNCFFALLLALLLSAPGLTAADTFLGVNLGAASASATNTDITLDNSTISKGNTEETFVPLGLRFGTYLKSIPSLGLALDFTMNGKLMDSEMDPFTRIWSCSALAMYRISFKESSLYPNGSIQAYFALGPALFLTEIFQFLGPPEVPDIELFAGNSSDVGLDFRTGLTWMLEPKLGVYVEYRYTQFKTDYTQTIPAGTLRFSPELKSHDLNLGIVVFF